MIAIYISYMPFIFPFERRGPRATSIIWATIAITLSKSALWYQVHNSSIKWLCRSCIKCSHHFFRHIFMLKIKPFCCYSFWKNFDQRFYFYLSLSKENQIPSHYVFNIPHGSWFEETLLYATFWCFHTSFRLSGQMISKRTFFKHSFLIILNYPLSKVSVALYFSKL